jgi:hypothetical protein
MRKLDAEFSMGAVAAVVESVSCPVCSAAAGRVCRTLARHPRVKVTPARAYHARRIAVSRLAAWLDGFTAPARGQP